MEQRKMGRTLLFADYEDNYIRQIKDALGDTEIVHLRNADKETLVGEIEKAEIMIFGKGIDPAMLTYGKKAKWVHIDAAGLNDFAKPMIFEKNIMVTGTAGRSENALAEHCFYLMLALNYKTSRLLQNQKNHYWESGIYSSQAALYGKTIGIVGFGHTGKYVAEYAKAFHMRVLCYTRKEKETACVDEWFRAGENGALERMLPYCDYVALTCALTDETWHLINEDRIRRMKETACLINMARGAVVDEKALFEALKEGEIAGAGCDTFEKEPLAQESPLWDLPNMIITPHCTPAMPDKLQRSVDILCENIRRYRNGETLQNLLKEEDVYTNKR